MFKLEKDVYLVTGIACAAIYDSRNGFVYHLDRDAKCALSALLSGETPDAASNEAVQLVQYLTANKLLSERDSDWDGNIQRLQIPPNITFAWIEITTTCNLKCIHCYEGGCQCEAAAMPFETFIRTIDELLSCGVKQIQLIGGEPLTAAALKDCLDYCHGKFDLVEVYTNGTLINQDWVNYFKQQNINIALSVYSYTAEWHDRVTGVVGSWGKTNSAIKMLADAGVKYRVRNVLIKGIPLGCKNTCLYTLNENRDVVRMVGRANTNLLSVENIKKRLITKHRFKSPIPPNRVGRMLGGHNCFATHLYFDIHGNVFPCVMERRISHGNILKSSLEQLLKPSILKFTKDYITGCKDCEFRYFCFDCRPDSLGESISDKPWYCTYQPETGQWKNEDDFIANLQKKYKL